jgi:transcriptional regulator with XRE-family HTH domain
MNQEITEKIKKIRISKGYNHQDMADKLNITRSAYQRLESGETYSWAKYFEEIMGILETNPKEFFQILERKFLIRRMKVVLSGM